MDKPVTNERLIRSVETSMRTEGFTVSDRAKRDGLELLSGKTTADDIIKKYMDEYKRDD